MTGTALIHLQGHTFPHYPKSGSGLSGLSSTLDPRNEFIGFFKNLCGQAILGLRRVEDLAEHAIYFADLSQAAVAEAVVLNSTKYFLNFIHKFF